jgi:predicted XRE-type DNA-binding protein
MDDSLVAERNLLQKRMASVDDVSQSAVNQLVNLVSWAKLIPSFAELTMSDKVNLELFSLSMNLLSNH